MTLAELITDLKAAGANENTIRLAMNCYELGQKEERAACADQYLDLMRRAIAAEREACCSDNVVNNANIMANDTPHTVIEKYQTSIRARGRAGFLQ